MVGRSEGFFVLYPIYFDSKATRAKGRRVTTAQAVRGATAKAVFEAAKAAGLQPVLEDEHHHPSAWFERTGRVLVPESAADTKTAAIQRVAEKLPAAHAAIGEKALSAGKPGAKGKHHKHKGRHRRR
jgi:signal recognition particle subunit SEC65